MPPFNWAEYIEERPGLLGGKPVVKGTRLAVDLVLRELGELGQAELLKEYPTLRPEHVQAVLEYAAAVVRMDA